MEKFNTAVEQDEIFKSNDCTERMLQEKINRLSEQYEGNEKAIEELGKARWEINSLWLRIRALYRFLNEKEA